MIGLFKRLKIHNIKFTKLKKSLTTDTHNNQPITMKYRKTLKIMGSLAIVGTIAAVAIYSTDAIKSSATFLAEDENDVEVKRNFQNFLSKHGKNYLTKSEYEARYT